MKSTEVQNPRRNTGCLFFITHRIGERLLTERQTKWHTTMSVHFALEGHSLSGERALAGLPERLDLRVLPSSPPL